MKYLKYYLIFFKMAFMEQMTFRANFFMWAVIHTIALLTYIIFFRIVFSQVVVINGWDLNRTLLVLGVGTLITGLGSLTFFPFMYYFGREVAQGEFDFRLLKPLDAHFQSAFHYPDIEDMSVVPVSVILIGYAIYQMKIPSIGINILGFVVMITSSLIILFSILTAIQSLAFKFVAVQGARDLFWSVANLAKYPAKSINNISFLSTIFLLPVALISSVPAEVLFGKWDWPWIAGSLLLAAASLLVSRRLFQDGVRNYSSASS